MVNIFAVLNNRPTFDRFNCESKFNFHKLHHCVSSQTCTPLRFLFNWFTAKFFAHASCVDAPRSGIDRPLHGR